MGNANLNPWTEAKVNTKSPERGPLLIIEGEKDHTVPWAIANAAYKRQRRNPGVTEIVKIPNRGHSLTIDHGWREVAQTALDFVKRFAAPADVPELVGVSRPKGRRMSTDATTPDTIVLIHGFWVTPRSWEDWKARYEDRGYRVLTPAYPGFEVEVEALNADPTPIEDLTVPAVIEHLESVVSQIEPAPILMGRLGWWRLHAAADG